MGYDIAVQVRHTILWMNIDSIKFSEKFFKKLHKARYFVYKIKNN